MGNLMRRVLLQRKFRQWDSTLGFFSIKVGEIRSNLKDLHLFFLFIYYLIVPASFPKVFEVGYKNQNTQIQKSKTK